MKTILQNPQTNATVQVGMINEFRHDCYMNNTASAAPKPAVVATKTKNWIWLAIAAVIGGGITYYATRKKPKKVNV